MTPTFPRRNFVLLLAQGSAYGLAGRLASTSIVLPFLCAALGGSLLVAGLLVPLSTLGTLVGYTLAPSVMATRLPSRVVLALSAVLSGLLLFLLAAVCLVVHRGGVVLSASFVGVALGTGLTSGAGTIAWTDVMARGIHPERRSVLLLGQAAIGGVLASVVALVSAWVFATRDPVIGHVALQWFAGGFLVVSGACALAVALDHAPTRPGPRRRLSAAFREGWAATRRYPWLRRYLTQQVLFLSVALATTFFSIRVATLHGSVPGSLAVVIAVTSAALVIGAPLWHRVMRWRGYRGMLVGGTACSALAAAGAVALERFGLAGTSALYHAVLMLLAALAADAVSVAKSARLVEQAPPAELAELSAFSQLTIGTASAVLAAAVATLAQVHGTVWPALVLLLLNLVAVAAALGVPRQGASGPTAASAGGGDIAATPVRPGSPDTV